MPRDAAIGVAIPAYAEPVCVEILRNSRWHAVGEADPLGGGKSTMVGLTQEQRRMLMDKLPDVANLVLGAFALSQLLGDRPYSLQLATFGVAIWLGFLGWAFLLGKERSRG